MIFWNNSRRIIFLVVIFSFLTVNPVVVEGTSYKIALTEIGSVAPSSSVINFQCIDNELMFSLDLTNKLTVFNITDPTNVEELDSCYLYHPHDIKLDLERELIFATASNGVNIFSYENLSDLKLQSNYLNYTHSTFIQLRDELLFIGAEDAGLQIVNVSNPDNPLMIGQWIDPIADIGQVYLVDNYAFVATRIPNTGASPTWLNLKVLNINDPTNITYVSTVDVGDYYNGGAPRAHDAEIVYFNDHAFGLKLLNFTNPENVSIIGQQFEEESFYNDLELLEDNLVVLADDYFGVRIVDCSILESPSLIYSYELDWRTLRVVVKDPILYVATLGGGVRILSMNVETKALTIHPLIICSNFILINVTLFTLIKRRNGRN